MRVNIAGVSMYLFDAISIQRGFCKSRISAYANRKLIIAGYFLLQSRATKREISTFIIPGTPLAMSTVWYSSVNEENGEQCMTPTGQLRIVQLLADN